MLQSDAVLKHDVEARMNKIQAPTLISFGKQDVATSSSRFADPLRKAIRQSELVIFEGCSHAPLYENVAEFNEKTLQFLNQQ